MKWFKLACLMERKSQFFLGPMIFRGSDLWDIQVSINASDISPLSTNRTKGTPKKWEAFQLESYLFISLI